MAKREYDSTVARIAGNILSGRSRNGRFRTSLSSEDRAAVVWAVSIARAIVTETKLTEPSPSVVEER